MESLVAKTVEAIQAADKARVPVTASYGTAADGKLLRDSREPYVKDDVLRVVRFDGADKKPACLLVNWTCHPEALASKNKEITADFPYYTIRDLEKKYGCPVLYISGAVGGLMAPPRDVYQKADGTPLNDGNFEYCEKLGSDVAKLAEKAIDAASPVELAPIKVAAKPITVPLENRLYRVAQMMGVLKRDGLLWTGNSEEFGRPVQARRHQGEAAAGRRDRSRLRRPGRSARGGHSRARSIPSWSMARCRIRSIRPRIFRTPRSSRR